MLINCCDTMARDHSPIRLSVQMSWMVDKGKQSLTFHACLQYAARAPHSHCLVFYSTGLFSLLLDHMLFHDENNKVHPIEHYVICPSPWLLFLVNEWLFKLVFIVLAVPEKEKNSGAGGWLSWWNFALQAWEPELKCKNSCKTLNMILHACDWKDGGMGIKVDGSLELADWPFWHSWQSPRPVRETLSQTNRERCMKDNTWGCLLTPQVNAHMFTGALHVCMRKHAQDVCSLFYFL